MPHLGETLELHPYPHQQAQFGRAAGCARLAWNWALAHWQQRRAVGPAPRWQDLQQAFVAIRDATYPFLRTVPSHVYYQAIRDLGKACQRFAKGIARAPRFKARHRARASFRLYGCRIQQGRLILPVFGSVRLKEQPRIQGRLVAVTIAADADRWNASLCWEVTPEQAVVEAPAEDIVGIDLGLTHFATCVATGPAGERVQQVAPPRPLRRHRKRLARLSRRLSRRQRGSKRRERARRAVARLHRRIRNLRKEFLHQLTTRLVRTHQTLVIEDLRVGNLLKNRRLAPHIADVGWYEFRRQLVYKSVRYRRTLLLADRFYPSSKRCSACGHDHAALTLSDRVFQCPRCGCHLDRDINAAKNLLTLAQRGNDARGEHLALVHAGCLQDQPAQRTANPGAASRGEKH